MANLSATLSMAAAIAACVLLLCAGAPVAMAQSCSTNANSPTQGDANACVQFIRNLGSTSCCQQSAGFSCTTMCIDGSVAVDICGNPGCTTCVNAGDAANVILANCVRNVNGAALVAGAIASPSPFFVQIRHS